MLLFTDYQVFRALLKYSYSYIFDEKIVWEAKNRVNKSKRGFSKESIYSFPREPSVCNDP